MFVDAPLIGIQCHCRFGIKNVFNQGLKQEMFTYYTGVILIVLMCSSVLIKLNTIMKHNHKN